MERRRISPPLMTSLRPFGLVFSGDGEGKGESGKRFGTLVLHVSEGFDDD